MACIIYHYFLLLQLLFDTKRMLQVTFDENHDDWTAIRPARGQYDSRLFVPNLTERGCEVIVSFVQDLVLYMKILRPNRTYASHKVIQLKKTVTNMCMCGVPTSYTVQFGAIDPGISQITSRIEVQHHGEMFTNWVHIFAEDTEVIRMMNRDYLKEKITGPLTQAQRGRFLSPEDLLPGYWKGRNRNSARRTASGDVPIGTPYCLHWERASEVD